MRRIALFGGSFSPVHLGHIALAKAALRQLGLDEVWLVVSPHNPLKTASELWDEQLRLRLVREAVADVKGLEACGVELEMPRPSYTCMTVSRLRELYPDCRFTLLIGGDNWQLFDRWRQWRELLSACDVAVYPRGAADKASAGANPRLAPYSPVWIDAPKINISSTEVRRRIAAGEAINSLVPQCVTDYVNKTLTAAPHRG